MTCTGAGLRANVEQPVVARMRGEIHENIDPVRADDVGELRVAERRDVAPSIHVPAHQAGDGVRRRHVGVRKHFDLPPVVLPEQRQHEARDRVLAKIGRHVAYAQPPLGLGTFACGRRAAASGATWRSAHARCSRSKIGGRTAGMVVQRQQQIAVQRRQIGT